jgi:hypothetical protein
MRSRFLAIAVAWLLGVITATAGSFVAVNGIAHGLLGTSAPSLAAAPIQGVPVGGQPSGSQPASSLSAADDGDKDTATPPSQPSVTVTSQATPQAAQPPGPASAGSLFTSPGGTVMASCQSGLAYLQYWSPSPGFQADDVIRGPAAQARIGFEHLTSEYVISVTCNGSNPVGKVTAG